MSDSSEPTDLVETPAWAGGAHEYQLNGPHTPFAHVVAGMHIGRLWPEPKIEEMDAVVDVSEDQASVEHGIRHKHAHIPYGGTTADIDGRTLVDAVGWVIIQVQADRRVLVRSDRGLQRPGLVVGCAILRLGGSYLDALSCLRAARPAALTDFRCLNVLKAWDRDLNKRGVDPMT